MKKKPKQCDATSAFMTKFRRQFRKFGEAAQAALRAGDKEGAVMWAREAARVHGNLARLHEAREAAKPVHWARQ